MSTQIWTAAIRYRGEDRVDCTRKSGDWLGFALAPTTALLQKYHPKWGGTMDWQAYSREYLEFLDMMGRRYPAPYGRLLNREEITLVCYCVSPVECHRTLAGKWLAHRGGVFKGERPKAQAPLPGLGDA